MARLFARGVVVVAGLVLVSGVVWAQTPTQTVVQTSVQTEGQLLRNLTQNPDQVSTYLDLAKLYTDLGRLDEAERMLHSGLAALQRQRQQQIQTAGTRALLPLSADVGGTPVRVGGAIKEPTRIRYVSPVYPEIARTARVSGVVILEVTIAPSGLVGDVKTLRPVALLDQAAIDAVKQWQFTPTILNGVAVPVTMTVTVNFAVSDPPAGSGAAVAASGPPPGLNAITTTAAAPSGNQPVRIGGEIKEPKKIRDVRPVYPQAAVTARVQGVVTIEAIIDRDGNVVDTKLVRSAHELLDTAAMDAVRQWKYTPTTINGVPVSVLMTVTVSFNLGI